MLISSLLRPVSPRALCTCATRYRICAADQSVWLANQAVFVVSALPSTTSARTPAWIRPVIGPAQTISFAGELVRGTAKSVQVTRQSTRAVNQLSIGVGQSLSTTDQATLSPCHQMPTPNLQAVS